MPIMNEPWYANGLLFSCVHCGRCCRRPGIVTLTAHELGGIAEFLDLPPEEFFQRFASMEGERFTLKDGSRGECIFYDWDTGLCRIYPSRPAQCRKYPFWPSLVVSKETWGHEGAFCPGIGQGDFHSRALIDAILAGERPPGPSGET